MSREILLPSLAAYVLEQGLTGLSLRPMAKAAGTSDRMLLYHFGSKDGLITALLEYLAGLYSTALDTAFSAEPPSDRRECVTRLLGIARTDAFRPFMRIWWDIVAAAAGGDAVYRDNADIMAARLLQWFEDHMPPRDPDPAGGAKLLFTLTEGAMMLDALGHTAIADAGIAAADL